MSPTNSAWDDTRLEAAFAARQAPAAVAPADLLAATLARIGGRPAGRATGRVQRLAPILGLAAALVIVVGLAGGRLATTPPAAGESPRSSIGSAAAPSSSASADGSAATSEPLTVSAALEVRARAGDDREITVAGFLSPWFAVPCPALLQPRNPTRLACPDSFQYLMENPEHLRTTTGTTTQFGPPRGPAIQPSFALVTRPDVPTDQPAGSDTAPVVLVGHFHDRRSALCMPHDVATCGQTFVVDRVAAIDGRPVGVATKGLNEHWDEATQTNIAEHPSDLEADVDRLVLGYVPGGSILSRQLVTIDLVLGIEPVLTDDGVVPHFDPAALMWIVTVLDSSDVPKARTFALIDGTNWFAEVTEEGAVMHDRRAAAGPSDGALTPVPSADPTAFDSAPTSVLGIQVRDVATVMRDRQATMDDLGRDELAIRAWYVGPNPAAACEPAAAPIHPPTPPCDEARRWLLDRPEQFGAEVGQLRTNPEHWPAVLNPLLPVDVPFDVPATWAGPDPVPRAVIVLGHFEDNRVDAYAGNLYFVLDALAWTRDRPVGTLDTLTRLTSAATEDPASVIARVGRISPNAAIATWTTVVDAADFGSVEPRTAADAPEFTSGRPVWIVRRLVHDVMDGRQRLAIEWAYTADGGTRVWLTETPDSSPDLVPTLTLQDPSVRTRSVRVVDYDDQVVAIRSTAGLDLTWQRIEPRERGLDVARGASDREVAIRWTGGRCDPDWQVQLRSATDGSGSVGVEVWTSGDFCPDDLVTRSLVLEFDHPIALDDLTTTWNPSGG
ncbi:MAG TPA: hypothetical protein VN773_07690 [Verrucomicrobiae bacterium]|nr:hypothetical protein [Verrucomicrobiae bacterium]